MNINKVVKRFKRDLKGQVTYENVAKYITEKGFSIILFDNNTEEILMYGLSKLASDHVAFTYIDNVNLIFIRRSCIEYQKLQLLLHEIAHIVLNHFDCHAPNSDEKEYQANMFAQMVLEKKHIHFSTVVLSVIVFISLMFNINFLAETDKKQYTEPTTTTSYANNKNPYSVDQATLDIDDDTAVYYITKTGSKYHKSKCSYAKNSYPVDKEIAYSFYSPCSHCNP